MDCSITTNYIKEKVRMTQYDTKVGGCQINCANCSLFSHSNGKGLLCGRFEKEYPEDAIAIVQKWSDEHPLPKPKTYADDFFEKFPNAPKEDDGAPKCCRKNVYGGVGNNFCNGNLTKCYKCWNEVLPDEV